VNKVYIVGDSHVSVFSGRDMVLPKWPIQIRSVLPALRPIHLGPVTAHHLDSEEATTQGRKLFAEVLAATNGRSTHFVVSAGEIDCRAHLLKKAEKERFPIENAVQVSIGRLMAFVERVRGECAGISVLTPPATSYLVTQDPYFPKHGTEVERNRVTQLFVDELRGACAAISVPVLDQFSWTVGPSFLTKREYYWDHIHLGTMAFARLVRELEAVLGLRLRIPVTWHLKEFTRRLKCMLRATAS
jgi:hypothetical protein